MPTLSQLAQSQQQTKVGAAQAGGVGSAGGTSIQPTQQVDKSAALVQDIEKMFGAVVSTKIEASEYAGKRVGTDNLVEYKRNMKEIDILYAGKGDITSADMNEKTRLEQGVYEMYMQKGSFSDNDIANQAFKDNYAVPATDDLFNRKKSNATLQTSLHKSEVKTKVASDINTYGQNIDQTTVNTLKQELRDSGTDPITIYGDIANSNNTALDLDYSLSGGRGFNFQNSDGSIDKKTEASKFNEYYSEQLKMDDEGNIAKSDPNLTDEAAAKMTNHWDARTYVAKTKAGAFNLLYFNAEAQSNDTLNQAKNGSISSAEIGQSVTLFTKAYNDANGYIPFDDTKNGHAVTKILNLEKQQALTGTAENDIRNNALDLRTLIKDGRTVNYFDKVSGQNIPTKVSAERYRAVITRSQENLSESLLSIDVKTDEGLNSFYTGMRQLDRLEEVSGITSSFTTKYARTLDPKFLTGIRDVADSDRLQAYMTFKSQHTPLNVNESVFLSNLDKVKNIPDLEEKDRLVAVNTLVSRFKENTTAQENGAELNAEIKAGQETLSEQWYNTRLAGGSTSATASYIADNDEMHRDSKTAIKNLKYVKLGSRIPFYGEEPYRVIIPQALSEKEFESFQDTVLSRYNKETKQDKDLVDLVPNAIYNRTTKDFEVEYWTRDGSWVGKINKFGAQVGQSAVKRGQ